MEAEKLRFETNSRLVELAVMDRFLIDEANLQGVLESDAAVKRQLL